MPSPRAHGPSGWPEKLGFSGFLGFGLSPTQPYQRAKFLTISVCPFSAAQWTGVSPFSSGALGFSVKIAKNIFGKMYQSRIIQDFFQGAYFSLDLNVSILRLDLGSQTDIFFNQVLNLVPQILEISFIDWNL